MAPPTPFQTVHVPTDIRHGQYCVQGRSEGGGNLYAFDGSNHTSFFMRGSGELYRSADVPSFYELSAQPEGYLYLTSTSDRPSDFVEVVWLGPDGAERRRTTTPNDGRHFSQFTPVPGGGYAFATVYFESDSQGRVTNSRVFFRRFDAQSRYVTNVHVVDFPGGVSAYVGVNTRGHALVVWRTDFRQAHGRWFDLSGTALTDVIDVPPWPDAGKTCCFTSPLEPLADGSLAWRNFSAWLFVIDDLATATREAPQWLKDRIGMNFFLIRGNRGMVAAVRTPGRRTYSSCEETAEVLAPSGKVCGILGLPWRAGSCEYNNPSISVGPDGTLVHHGPQDESCTLHTWPGLLK
jgi:hypothetical protein